MIYLPRKFTILNRYDLLLFLLFFLYLFCGQAKAQKNPTDSLISILKNPKNHDTTQLLSQIELAYHIRRIKTDSAGKIAEFVLAKSLKMKYLKGEARAYWMLGFVYWLKEQHEKGISYFEKSAQILEKIKAIPEAVQSLDDCGYVYYQQGNYSLALPIFLRALQISEKRNYEFGKVLSLISIGQINMRQKEYPEALQYFYKALKITQNIKNAKKEAECWNISGYTHYQAKEFEKAAQNLEKALKIRTKLQDKHGIATSTNNLGLVLMKKKEYKKALDYFEKALFLYDSLLVKDGILIAMANVANAHLSLGNTEKGIAFADKSLQLARLQRANIRIMESAIALYEVYKKNQKYEQALSYLELINATKDTIFNTEKAKLLKNVEAKYQLSTKEKEIKYLANENQLQFRLMLTAIIAFIFFMVASIIFYSGREKEKRAKQTIITQKEKEKELERDLASMKMKHEKERIARDLHDNIGGQLTYLARSLATSPDEKLNEMVGKAIKELRNTVWTVQHTEVSTEDIEDKIRNLINQIDTDIEIDVLFDLLTPSKLSAENGINLFRIIQEALQNAIKYSKATQIEICLTLISEKKLLLKIKDNGIGFDLEQAYKKREHYGLLNMQARAELMQADFKIRTQPSKGGTSIEIILATKS
ncbi:MAG: tetratricopeptide repeat protein [Cytophagia bacterium]|nr:MAG: tetratricopeptide repeat protein [Cytophagia bacterium]